MEAPGLQALYGLCGYRRRQGRRRPPRRGVSACGGGGPGRERRGRHAAARGAGRRRRRRREGDGGGQARQGPGGAALAVLAAPAPHAAARRPPALPGAALPHPPLPRAAHQVRLPQLPRLPLLRGPAAPGAAAQQHGQLLPGHGARRHRGRLAHGAGRPRGRGPRQGRRLVRGGAGRRAPRYHLPAWQRGHQGCESPRAVHEAHGRCQLPHPGPGLPRLRGLKRPPHRERLHHRRAGPLRLGEGAERRQPRHLLGTLAGHGDSDQRRQEAARGERGAGGRRGAGVALHQHPRRGRPRAHHQDLPPLPGIRAPHPGLHGAGRHVLPQRREREGAGEPAAHPARGGRRGAAAAPRPPALRGRARRLRRQGQGEAHHLPPGAGPGPRLHLLQRGAARPRQGLLEHPVMPRDRGAHEPRRPPRGRLVALNLLPNAIKAQLLRPC